MIGVSYTIKGIRGKRRTGSRTVLHIFYPHIKNIYFRNCTRNSENYFQLNNPDF